MNILFVANKSETGGAPKSLQSLILKLKENNNITVITPKKGIIYGFCKKNNIKVVRTFHEQFLIYSGNTTLKKYIRKLLIPILKIRHYMLNKVSMYIVKRNIDIDNIEIIHTNFYRDDIGGLLAKKYNKIHIVHLREFGNLDYDCLSLVKNKIKYLDKYTTKFIAISEAIKKHYTNQGIQAEKITLIYNGIENLNISRHINRNDNRLKMILVGNITEEKGQMDVLQSLLLLDKERLEKISVDFYGQADTLYRKKIEKFILKNDLSNNVNIHEYVDNIYDILKNYDIGLMCSKAEAFGRVTVEYMSAGLLTIASDCGANPEIIDNRVDGFLYDKNNLKTFTDILNYIFDNDCEEIRLNAIKKVENNFTYIKNANMVNDLYLRCIKECCNNEK